MIFLNNNQILFKNQYGFRLNHCTYMAIMEMQDKISSAIDKGDYAVGIFLDLSKAFDTLDHDILLAKLEYYGIRGLALDWFKSYLHCRKQYVFLNGQSSTMSPVVCGVPQGSILGPLLFLLYINDIAKCSDILNFILFADDTNLFYSNKELRKLVLIVNWELSKLSDWFKANKLSLNAIKSNFIIFGSKRFPNDFPNINLTLDGNKLERATCSKFLGVFLDEKLKWAQHLNHIANKMARGLGIMGRVCKILPRDILRTLYFSLIYPYLIYCCIIWGSASATALHKLEVLQNRTVRIITRSPFRASASPIYKQLNILKLCDVRRLQIVLFMYKCKYALLPESCMNYCTINFLHSYNMRNVHYFAAQPFRTSIREHSICVEGPRVWDSLPVPLQASESIETLKRNVTKHFISLY